MMVSIELFNRLNIYSLICTSLIPRMGHRNLARLLFIYEARRTLWLLSVTWAVLICDVGSHE